MRQKDGGESTEGDTGTLSRGVKPLQKEHGAQECAEARKEVEIWWAARVTTKGQCLAVQPQADVPGQRQGEKNRKTVK